MRAAVLPEVREWRGWMDDPAPITQALSVLTRAYPVL